MRLTDAQYFTMKEQIKDWLLQIDEEEMVPKGIKVLHFSLQEPYSIELSGSKVYNTDDDDWIFRDDFSPELRVCPELGIEVKLSDESFLKTVVRIMKDLSANDLKNLDLFRVSNLTTGFAEKGIVCIR
ncbi:MAG: hypothetical protein ACRCSQ_10615 [Bacteroidales bacterium]